MKRATATVLVPLLALGAVAPAAGERPEIDRQALLAHLERTRALFTAAVAGLTPEQAAWKESADRWSVAEVAEHLAVSEDFLRGLVASMLAAEATAELLEGAVKDERVLALIVDRSQRFQAPEAVVPSGRWPSLEATIEHFEAARAATTELVGGAGDLRRHAQNHPLFGSLDAVGWVYFLSSHTERHTLQIEEVKASPGFPAG